MDIILEMSGVAWLAIALVLLLGVAAGALRLFRARPPLPFFAMLRRQGLTFAQVERALGDEALVEALRRCAGCGARRDCGRRLFECPNEPVFLRTRAFVKAGL